MPLGAHQPTSKLPFADGGSWPTVAVDGAARQSTRCSHSPMRTWAFGSGQSRRVCNTYPFAFKQVLIALSRFCPFKSVEMKIGLISKDPECEVQFV